MGQLRGWSGWDSCARGRTQRHHPLKHRSRPAGSILKLHRMPSLELLSRTSTLGFTIHTLFLPVHIWISFQPTVFCLVALIIGPPEFLRVIMNRFSYLSLPPYVHSLPIIPSFVSAPHLNLRTLLLHFSALLLPISLPCLAQLSWLLSFLHCRTSYQSRNIFIV